MKKFMFYMIMIVFLTGCQKEIDLQPADPVPTGDQVPDGCNPTIYTYSGTPIPGNSEQARSSVNFQKVEMFVRSIQIDDSCKNNCIANLSKQLTSSFSNPYEKVYAIYHWLNFNIDYDWVMYNSGDYNCHNQNSLQVLKRKLGVCEGQSNLFASLCKASSISAVKISGLAKISNSQGNHAWNAVQIANKWYLLDVTWDEVTKKKSINYFLISPQKFYQNHIPNYSSEKWKLFGSFKTNYQNQFINLKFFYSKRNQTNSFCYEYNILSFYGKKSKKQF